MMRILLLWKAMNLSFQMINDYYGELLPHVALDVR